MQGNYAESISGVTMESFIELLHKLQEVHEREVEGWQVKVKELSNKKGCETKRMEELFTRNQQMKEQHRVLTENIKTLENRLRAGLCDRCTVTQEVAKRRQQEFEASQIQSLQHLSILATEITNLKKENIRLKDEMRGLRAALNKGQSDHSSNSSTATEVKPNSSPDLSPSSGPVALVAPTTSRSSKQPADGDVVVKTEADQRSEEAEHRQSRGTNRSSFVFKPLATMLSTPWEPEQSVTYVGEKRKSVEGRDQHASIPPQPPRKNSSSLSGGEVKPSRPVIHAPIPCHPRPVKTSSISLPWSLSESSDWTTMAVPGTNSMVQNPSRQQLPRFPNLIPPIPQVRRHSFGPTWQNQSTPQPQTKEPTVVFKLKSLPEYAENQTKPQERKESPSCKSEKVSGEELQDTCDGPLDLSDRGKPKSSQTFKDETPIALQVDVKKPRSLDSDVNTQIPVSSPSLVFHSSPCTPFKQEQEPSSDHNHEAVREQEQREEVSGKTDQSNGRKVPVLTLSLRPVVMLETLNSALQKQASSSSNGKVIQTNKANMVDAVRSHLFQTCPPVVSPCSSSASPQSSSPSIEAESSSDEQHEDESGSEPDSSQGCKRKRPSGEAETERDSDTSNIRKERRIKITVRTEERSPS
ncbi:uncharacterized protein rbbp8l isoform X2 [Melanotaenia boesemani]|uniref:uncharacterized protein rbbp8l isoform X2 n=1 Tax=Melanotaenia boesemani TaxID=1250792 RepID=UPI001C052604|nr:uncharacterized protein rbbp8l isoform X2 [Melanotaenia boesemani]